VELPSLAVPDGGGPGRTPDAAPPSPVEDDRAPAAPGVRQCKLACLQWEFPAAGARSLSVRVVTCAAAALCFSNDTDGRINIII